MNRYGSHDEISEVKKIQQWHCCSQGWLKPLLLGDFLVFQRVWPGFLVSALQEQQ